MFFCFVFVFFFFFFFMKNFYLTKNQKKKKNKINFGSDGGLKKDCKVIFVVVVVVVHMYGLPVHLLSFISYFIYTLKVTRVQC